MPDALLSLSRGLVGMKAFSYIQGGQDLVKDAKITLNNSSFHYLHYLYGQLARTLDTNSVHTSSTWFLSYQTGGHYLSVRTIFNFYI